MSLRFELDGQPSLPSGPEHPAWPVVTPHSLDSGGGSVLKTAWKAHPWNPRVWEVEAGSHEFKVIPSYVLRETCLKPLPPKEDLLECDLTSHWSPLDLYCSSLVISWDLGKQV